MRLMLRTRRSAGVPVTAAVHRSIARGNAARDGQRWAEAARAYGQALEAAPELAHIWVQLGHSQKEQGLRAEARASYERADAIRPGDADTSLHLGHLFGELGEHAKAGRYYLAAFKADPGLIDAASALHRVLARATGRARDQLVDVLRGALDGEVLAPAVEDAAEAAEGACLVYDVSDLIGYFGHSRLPTGIQRVQIQAVSSAAGRVRACCFVDGRDDWLEIPLAAFRQVCALSCASGDRNDPVWIRALHRLHLRLALTGTFVFPQGSVLVNLGASWQLHNYFLFVREAKARYGIRYVPFVHDLIPVVAPEHFTKGLVREFVAWVVGVLRHADHFLVNSESTRRDLVRVAATLGHRLDPEDVAVIRLDADVRTPGEVVLGDAALGRWGLEAGGYVLLVSTVESRKGHVVAFEAWLALLARHGAARVPMLVCVGRKGWLSGRVYEMLEQEPVLAGRVAMLSGLSDEELGLLYRRCAFTIYPSLYEGWGLPVTEALCHGRAVICSDSSSLPEAGGVFATYVPPGSSAALAAAVERMAFDGAWRAGVEARIAAGFRARSWGEVAQQIEQELGRLAARRGGPARVAVPMARAGAYHSVGLGTALRVWPGLGSGEAFRCGAGWHAPGPEGSWTRAQGGELAIGVAPGSGALRVGLLLVGAHEGVQEWRVRVKGGPVLEGTLLPWGRPGGRKWVTFTVDGTDAVLRIRVRGEWADPDPAWPEEERAHVGVAGFFLHAMDDVASGMRLLEAIALGNLDEVDADRAPVLAAADDGWDGPA